MNATKLEILTLGNELLIGLRTNAHLTYLGDQLSRRGLHPRRNVVINDEEVSIGREFLASWGQADIVITTGGLGATADDITRECVAHSLGLEMVHDSEIEEQLHNYFRERGAPMPAINRKIAYRPEGAEVLPNRVGTAPGLWLEREGKTVIMLPGPSAELQDVFEEEVLPRLRKKGVLGEEEDYVQIRTAGLGETFLMEKIQPLLDLCHGVEVASCPHEGMVDLRLSSADGEMTRKKLEGLGLQIARRLGDDFVCFGHDSLENVVFEILRKRELTLAVAESCTGGLLASRFTDIPGASKVFLGGVVCYTNDAKVQILDIPEALINQHGAVSAEVAVALATGVGECLGSDYALSVTGFAGPDGGTEESPVGTVYLGLDTPDDSWARKVYFSGGRLHVRKQAVTALLDWLRRTLVQNKVPEPAEHPVPG
ncbi:MAG: competence/damage-inducible protein A [Opitutales bacterium]